MKLKRIVSSLLTGAMLLGMLTVVPTTVATTPVDAATSLLSAAKMNGTAKTPTAAQKAQIDQKFAGFVCWGDSLTSGTVGTSYAYRVGEYINSNLISNFSSPTTRVNYGVGGENVQSICARANVAPATLNKAITIPESGSVSISLSVMLFGQQGGGNNYAGISWATGPADATINGVEGTFSGSGSTLTFTRKTAGSAVPCAAGTQVIFTSGNLYDNQNYIPVVYMGYNSGADWCNNNFGQYSQLIDKLINKYPMGRAGRYVVICPHFNFTKVSVTKQVETKMEEKYGSHLIKTREFMCNYGLSESGVAAKSGDTQRIAEGKIPTALMASDDVHFNNDGYQLLARMLYQKMYDLGYFNEVISILGINLTPGTGGGGGDTPTHTHTPGAAATCTTPQKCTSCQAVIVAALGHDFVNGKCTRCSATDPSAYTTSVNDGCNTALSQKYNFDLYAGDSGYGYGKLSFAQCVDRSKVAAAASAKKVEASAIGAYMTRGVLLDSNAGNTGMSWLATSANGSERVYANGTVNGDVPYVVYKVKAPSGTIDTVNVKINAGNLCKLRAAVYVTDNLGYNSATGSLNFPSFKFLGSFESNSFETFYKESEAKSFTLASGQISGKSELYVVIALTNYAENPADEGRLSGTNTMNARITAIQIEATASGSTPTHTHTPGAAVTCTTPQICTSCKEVIVAALGHNYVNGECTRCHAKEPGTQPAEPTGKSLSIAQHYDLYSADGNYTTGANNDGTYGIGKLPTKPVITRSDVASSASSKSVSASTIGAYAVHNMFLDCSNANNQAMTFLTTVPTGTELISTSGSVSGDAPYVVYKVSSGDAASYIKSLSVDLFAGHLYKFRAAIFVTDTLKYTNQASGIMDFSGYKLIGNLDCTKYDSMYNPYGSAKEGAARFTLSDSQLSALGNKSELYVVIAVNSYRATGSGCLSGTDTGDSRITGVAINATASEPSTPVHTHTMQHTAAVTATCKAAGNIEYWYCTGCQKYFSDAIGQYEITRAATVIAKSNVHSYGQTYSSDASGHWQACGVCGTLSEKTAHTPNVPTATTTTAKYCEICKYEIEPIVIPGEVMKGDVNDDNVVTSADVGCLIDAINTQSTGTLNQNCDFNHDGKIDLDDARYLLNYSLRPDLFPIA